MVLRSDLINNPVRSKIFGSWGQSTASKTTPACKRVRRAAAWRYRRRSRSLRLVPGGSAARPTPGLGPGLGSSVADGLEGVEHGLIQLGGFASAPLLPFQHRPVVFHWG